VAVGAIDVSQARCSHLQHRGKPRIFWRMCGHANAVLPAIAQPVLVAGIA
jgi:hypothetical protein